MKCDDCAIVDFCQAGFWEHCKDWEGNKDDNKQCTILRRPRNDIDGTTITTEGEPQSTITGIERHS